MKRGEDALSCAQKEPMHTTAQILDWLQEHRKTTGFCVNRIGLKDCSPWYFDKQAGQITNAKKAFFSIEGIKAGDVNAESITQPIINQSEIGLLGIVCRRMEGTLHFLLQAKDEPGNENGVQLSPTVQATMSNILRKHGGKRPAFLDVFLNASPEQIIVDTLETEYPNHFYKKRNRNMLVLTQSPIDEGDFHRWVSLAQLKEILEYDSSLINVDTRSVLQCFFAESLLLQKSASINTDTQIYRKITNRLNAFKMFEAPNSEIIPLDLLDSGVLEEDCFVCAQNTNEQIGFFHVNIVGREVNEWNQPLIENTKTSLCGLLCRESNGTLQLLLKLSPAIGCFDIAEWGPTVQMNTADDSEPDETERMFLSPFEQKAEVLADYTMPEDGGRFFGAKRRNIILLCNNAHQPAINQEKYVWADLEAVLLAHKEHLLNYYLRDLLFVLFFKDKTDWNEDYDSDK